MESLTVVCHVHNELAWLPLFFEAWTPITGDFHILDDGSTDGTQEWLIAHAPYGTRVTGRQSTEWQAQEVDATCRALERRTVLDGWVLSVTVDELPLQRHSHFEEVLLAAARDPECVAIPAYLHDMVQRPEDPPVDPRYSIVDQYQHGYPTGHWRLCHRFQQDADWEYNPGRHSPNHLPLFSRGLLLGDFRFAPKEMAFQRRLVCAERVGSHDQGRGHGVEKVGFSRERFDAEYQEALTRASLLGIP